MANKHLTPGTTARISFIVEEKHLAAAMLSGEARVFATPMLVAGMEQAAVELLRPFMNPGESTVGVHMDAYHNAATPLGMKVTFEAILVDISPNGKGFSFQVKAYDEAGAVGEGRHERVLVNLARFEDRAKKRKQ